MRPARELEERFDITSERIVEIDEMASRGELPGRPVGSVIVGKPDTTGDSSGDTTQTQS